MLRKNIFDHFTFESYILQKKKNDNFAFLCSSEDLKMFAVQEFLLLVLAQILIRKLLILIVAIKIFISVS